MSRFDRFIMSSSTFCVGLLLALWGVFRIDCYFLDPADPDAWLPVIATATWIFLVAFWLIKVMRAILRKENEQ